MKSIDEENVINLSAKDLVVTVDRKHSVKVKKARGRQVEIYVGDNIIRWILLRLQSDDSRWLGLPGSNCTMTQLQIKLRGLDICDFFAAYVSEMPVTNYASSNHKNV